MAIKLRDFMAPVAAAAANGRVERERPVARRRFVCTGCESLSGVRARSRYMRPVDSDTAARPPRDVYIFMRLPPVIGSINAVICHARPLPVLIIFTV
jgi:hypothetical protein